MLRQKIAFLIFNLICVFLSFSQINLFNQSGNATDNWSFSSTGADATALAQSLNHLNYTSAPQSLVVGGNTGGGSCIDGGSGNGPSVERTFTFESVDISSSNQFNRTLTFNWGNRHPVCTGTGWDMNENLIFIPIHDGIEQSQQTLATGGNDAIFSITSNSYNYQVPPCVSNFGFILYISTNRRDELLFLDDVLLTTPGFNNPIAPTIENLSLCQNLLPFSWNGLTINEAGTYNLTLTNVLGCDSLVQLNLAVIESEEFTDKISLCSSETPFNLHGTIITQSGEYPIIFPSSDACDSLVVYVVTVHEEYSQQFNITICENELPYSWSGESIQAAGQYISNLTSAFGCDSTVILNLTVNPIPEVNFTADNTQLTTDNTTVNFTNNSPIADLSVWNFGDGNNSNQTSPQHTFPAESGTYTVSLTIQAGGCSNSHTLQITVIEEVLEVEFILPNVFSPNGDGINDLFTNSVQNAESIELVVLNRWGAPVFETNNPESAWDGTDQKSGLSCVEGVYFYKLSITDKSQKVHTHNSFVHLVR